MKSRHLFVMAMLAATAVNSVWAQNSESLYAGDPGGSDRTYTSEELGGGSMSSGSYSTPGSYGTEYKGVDDFFRVREANPNVKECVWQFELNTAWQTFRSGSGRDDDWNVGASIKYGITEDLFAEFAVLPVNIGDGNAIEGYSNHDGGWWNDRKGVGDSGNGESSVKLFWRFLREQEVMPAMAVWSEMRLPTGVGSEKVDFDLHFNMTKTIIERLRAHLTGWGRSANGSRGDYNDSFFGSRRDFQWGLGTGVDYALNEENMLVLNYENRSSNYDGNANTNHYEAGWVHDLTETQQLMISAIYDDVRGEQEGPRWTAQFQWSIAF